MEGIALLKNRVADYLRSGDGLCGAKIATAFAPDPQEFPLRTPVVTVGLDAVELACAGFGGYWGEQAQPGGVESLYGSGALLTLRLDLYAPAQHGAHGLYELYDALCDRLLLRANPFGLTKLGCGALTFDKAAHANCLCVRAVLRAAVLLRDEEAAIQQFDVIRKDDKA